MQSHSPPRCSHTVLAAGALVALLCSSPVIANPLMETVEHDGVTGKLEALDETKARLDERARSNPESAVSLRYDRAFVAWRISRVINDRRDEKKRHAALLEEAAEYLEAVLEDDPDHVESMVLLAAVLSDQAGRSMFKRMTLGRRAYNLSARALELAPDNPRAAVQRGKIILYVPALMGGGPTNAIKLLERARTAFAKEDDSWPNWGQVDAHGWYGRALAQDGRIEEARAVYQEALVIEPQASWIRDELLPALD